MKKCNKCGFENPDNATRCLTCGGVLDEIQVENNNTVENVAVNNNIIENQQINTNYTVENSIPTDNFQQTYSNNNMNVENQTSNINNTVNNVNNGRTLNEPVKTTSVKKILLILFIVALVILVLYVVFIVIPAINITTKNNNELKNRLAESDLHSNISVAKSDAEIEMFKTKSDYVIIKYPYEEEPEYRNFDAGYIILYSDGSEAAKLSVDNYCATKDYDEKEFTISSNGPCTNLDIEYKK